MLKPVVKNYGSRPQSPPIEGIFLMLQHSVSQNQIQIPVSRNSKFQVILGSGWGGGESGGGGGGGHSGKMDPP